MCHDQSPIPVALCEDDGDLRDILAAGLPHFGFRVFGVPSAECLDTLLANRGIELLILDLGLPGEDGFSVAHRLRHERPGIGIVILTARSQLEERIRGLSVGADLYFVKPVDLEELAMALGNLHRRITQGRSAMPRVWRLNKRKAELDCPAGQSIALTLNEVSLLGQLMDKRGSTVERHTLCGALGWGPDEGVDHRLQAMISRLRKKVAAAGSEEPLPIKAHSGQGYVFLTEDGPEP
jgi:DNA-binding response OmpR family regulator